MAIEKASRAGQVDEKALVLAGMDTTGLTEAEKAELAAAYKRELEATMDGIEFRPSRIKIQKDSCTFVDEFGQSMEELVGVIVYKQRTRGLWQRGNKIPLCSSMDGKTGVESATGVARSCASCPNNAWGSGTTEAGQPTRGKACKEMRRVFVAQSGAYIPVFISLPPTSLKAFDTHISARLSKGIPDTAVETIFKLVPTKSENGFAYAVISCKMGRRLSAQEMLEYSKMRDLVATAAAKIGVTEEEYMEGGDEEDGASATGEGAGDVPLPNDSDQPF